jgi:NAD(P)H-dependent FMN reductase
MTPQADPALALGVVAGSTRPGRRSTAVAGWVLDRARALDGVRAHLVDLADHNLPLLDEPAPPITGVRERSHTREWAAAVAPLDAYVFVLPEYNRSVPGALKNALDFLYAEWRDKVAGCVSYGVDAGGARATEHLRLVLAELHVATVRDTVALSLGDDFDGATPAPRPFQDDKLDALLDRVVAWGGALRDLRRREAAAA